jgi:hypothetical protein
VKRLSGVVSAEEEEMWGWRGLGFGGRLKSICKCEARFPLIYFPLVYNISNEKFDSRPMSNI